MHGSYFFLTFFKANMNSDTPMQMAAIFFFHRTFIWNRVLARCMSWLISFTLASWSCKERKRDLQNEKFFLPTAGLKLTTPGLRSQRRNPWTCNLTHYRLVNLQWFHFKYPSVPSPFYFVKSDYNWFDSNLRRKKKICVFPVTRPTLIFCCDPKVFIAFEDKMP